jgi:hypothetical protein
MADATMKGPVGLPDVRRPDGTEAAALTQGAVYRALESGALQLAEFGRPVGSTRKAAETIANTLNEL